MANTSPEARKRREYVLQQWAALQRDYPQYTKNAYVNFLSDKAIKRKYGQGYNALAFGDPTTGQVAFNTDQFTNVPERDLDYVITKELGQANAPHMVGSVPRADALLNAWGYKGDRSYRTPDSLVGAGPHWGQADSQNALQVGPFRSYPQDLYGVEFAAALGRLRYDSGAPTAGLLDPLKRAVLQRQGILPQRNPAARPLEPQMPQPNVSDTGHRIDRAQVPATYVNPLVVQLAQIRQLSERDQGQLTRRGIRRGPF